MTVELKPEQERIIREQIDRGAYKSVEEVLTTALSKLDDDTRFEQTNRREAVSRMLEFGKRHHLSLGEPITRELMHEGHRH
jgi:Arc/MetJ-type ribon-helix-helix transcriptional regulator